MLENTYWVQTGVSCIRLVVELNMGLDQMKELEEGEEVIDIFDT